MSDEQSPIGAAIEAGRKAQVKRLRRVGSHTSEVATATAEVLLGTGTVLEAGTQFPLPRVIGEGLQNAFTQGLLHPNLQEIPKHVGQFFSTLHPEQAIPFGVLLVATGGAEWLRRTIRKRRG